MNPVTTDIDDIDPNPARPIRVDVWSSIECPWCYIGKRRLESAIADFSQPVQVVYHSTHASPPIPDGFEGNPIDYVSKHQGYSREEAEQTFAEVIAIAKSVGLNYDYARIRQTDTSQADQLIHYARLHGRQGLMVERLLRAFFVDGEHLGDPDVLGNIAEEIGLNRADAIDAVTSGELTEHVEADRRQAERYGIQGVPFTVINQRYGLSGAQDSSVFLEALRLAQRDAR